MSSATTLSETTLSLSVEAIKESVYAISAMRSYLSDTDRELPPMLTRDHSAALTPVVRDAAVYVAMRLPDLGMDIVAADDELVTITAMLPASAVVPVRHALESAVQMRVISCCFMSCRESLAARYGADCESLITALREKAGANTALPRLRPVRY
ncbi:MAG: hypothetical protein HDS41_00880 [Bacteroides sp.]|nr:hypothetical protein [Bacteroides sp.]